MRCTLADNLNLMGTARYNLAIRYKRSLINRSNTSSTISLEERKKIPAGWEKVLPFWNHSELSYVNQLAADVHPLVAIPFPNAEPLPDDNGERFFSEYLTITKPRSLKYNEHDICICEQCCQQLSPTKPTLVQQQEAQTNLNRQQARPTVEEQQIIRTARAPAQTVQHHQQYQPIIQQPTFAFQQFVPPLPYFYNTICCPKYERWLSVRLGRPPHDGHCYYRRQQQSMQQQQLCLIVGETEKERKEKGRDKL